MLGRLPTLIFLIKLVRQGVKLLLLLDGDLVLEVLVFFLIVHLKGFTNHFQFWGIFYNVTGLGTRNKRMRDVFQSEFSYLMPLTFHR